MVVAGPTASGKTALGIDLAQRLDGEIISADARQVYQYMDIGTAKPTAEERAAVPHHLIDFVDPAESYNAGQFALDAADVISDLQKRGKLPIVVGGAGLYIRALLDGFSPMPEIPNDIRERLQKEAEAHLGDMYGRLGRVDPEWADKVQPSDRQRIVRGLEVFEASGTPLSEHQKRSPEPPGNWTASWFGLMWDREILYERINTRACQMFADGLVDEVKCLQEKGYSSDLNALNTFGYREVFEYLAGEVSQEQALADLQQGTRRYAKRQMTWFRGEARMQWVDPVTHPSDYLIASLEKS